MVAAFVIGIGIGLALGILLGLVIADMSTSPTLINTPMPSGPIHGNVTGIIDANTLEINGVQVRTTLVDVPEPDEFPNVDIMYPINRSCPIGSPAAYDVDDLVPEDGDGVALAAIWCDKMGRDNPLNDQILDYGYGIRYCGESEFRLAPWLDGACKKPGE